MKIAQITKYFYPHRGGIESHVLGISKEFVEKGLNVKVFTSNIPKGKRREEINGIKVFRSPVFFTFSNGPFSPGILMDLLNNDYDLIHLHLPDPFFSIFAYIASLIKRKPLVVTYHADIIKDRWYEKLLKIIYYPILYLILRHSKRIIATSPNYVKESSVLKHFIDKIEIAPNFVDEKRFNPDVSGENIRRRYKLENKKVVLFLGRFVPYKGIEYLIDAFIRVKDNIENSVLLLVGDGVLRKKLMNLAKDEENIIFIKPKENEIPEYYAACDLFVLPSITRQEAFGITLLEAMATGKVCITTNISGMPYVVNNCGIKISPKDVDALKYAIIELLGNDAYRKRMGKCGRKRVEEYFTRKRVADIIFNIYKNIV